MDGGTSSGGEERVAPGDLAAQVRETHTGVVVLLGDRAFKAKKPVVTDFLDFSTTAHRERACMQEIALNRRLAPDSYLGLAHFSDPQGGPAEPVIVMRRHPDNTRLASLLAGSEPVEHQLLAIARVLARFHASAGRGPKIDAQGTAAAVWARWQENLDELQHRGDDLVPSEVLRNVARMASRFVAGRHALFGQRIDDRRILEGHADLLADDIFCLPEGPALLDCLEFDDRLRYVDGVDDAAFLAMDLEFLGRRDIAEYFLDQYIKCAGDPAPRTLIDFYVAYRAVVRAKVDCVRVAQGHREATADARRHLGIAEAHLRAGAVRLIIVGGGPGSGKTTLSKALAARVGAEVISTDDVRRQLRETGVLSGDPGELDGGLYSPKNVAAVYDQVLEQAQLRLSLGHSVILDGTWRDPKQRDRARELSHLSSAPLVEFNCTVPIAEASARIERRPPSNSDATPVIAAALAGAGRTGPEVHDIDTARQLSECVRDAEEICWRAS